LLRVCGQGWSTHTPSALELAGAAHSRTHVVLFWDITNVNYLYFDLTSFRLSKTTPVFKVTCL